jgi:hypothetical protein
MAPITQHNPQESWTNVCPHIALEPIIPLHGAFQFWGKLTLAKVWQQLSNPRRLRLSVIVVLSRRFATFARFGPQSEIHAATRILDKDTAMWYN